MKGSGKFRASLNRCSDLFSHAGFRYQVNNYPSELPSFFDFIKNKSAVEVYKAHIDNGQYSYLLSDGSLFLFKHDEDPSEYFYTFIQSPYESIDRDTFFHDFGEVLSGQSEETIEWEYEQFISEQENRTSLNYLRYDYSESQYNEGQHPVGHLHIGHATEIRFSLERILTPTAFSCCVLRQVYPHLWKGIISKMGVTSIKAMIRDGLPLIENRFRGELDYCELQLR